jgi:coproporphyrinogen III oxidase-like Fe-S oxidoreductase
MKVERKDICKNLPKKGFKPDDTKHHLYFHFYYKGSYTGIYTYVSHSTNHKDYSNRLLTEIRMQLKLNTTQQVVDLVNCPMNEQDYIQILIDSGAIAAS